VAAVEIFHPAHWLSKGVCLVDTPGLGSVFLGNTEETRAFVPHVDAALVVLGVDPPIGADELVLVEEVAPGDRPARVRAQQGRPSDCARSRVSSPVHGHRPATTTETAG
jgi:hypothetical protein